MTSHFRNECIHGVVLGQCRCPAENKTVNLVACPPGHENMDPPVEKNREKVGAEWTLNSVVKAASATLLFHELASKHDDPIQAAREEGYVLAMQDILMSVAKFEEARKERNGL